MAMPGSTPATGVVLLAGQGWGPVGDLALALVLSALIGLEREVRQKSAGLRTHTLVGFAAALIVLVSKYGFDNVLLPGRIVVDPSRVAAQIVSGIGFIGGGLIFVRRDAVRGLTTAAVVWLTAAVGMAAGAGLPVLAALVTLGHFIVVYGFTPLARRLPATRYTPTQLRLSYLDAHGVLRRALVECTSRGFAVNEVAVERPPAPTGPLPREPGRDDRRDRDTGPAETGTGAVVSVVLRLTGAGSVAELTTGLADLDGVVAVSAGDLSDSSE